MLLTNNQVASHMSETFVPSMRPILVIDDEIPIIELLRDLLEDEGFVVLTATNGKVALKLVQQQVVGLIITDQMMPQLTGTELAEQLRSDPQTAAIPLLLMSAALPEKTSDLFVAFVQKPFNIEDILLHVRRVFGTI